MIKRLVLLLSKRYWGEALAQLKHQVSEITEKSKIEIITISRPEAYGEYSPYRIMGTKEEFIKEVKREYGSSL